MNPETAIKMFVGANSFAHDALFVRMNSHLHKPHNAVNFRYIHLQLRFLQ